MAQFVPVSRERHADKRWRRPENYAFAASDGLTPAFGAELFRLALTMPVAFVEQGGRRQLMSVMSLAPGRNMYVGSDGRWYGNYIPAFFRSYPFRLLQREGSDDEYILCVDEDSGLIVGGTETGEPFFDAAGEVSAAMKPIVELVSEVGRSSKMTQAAVSALFEAGVIQPWKIVLKVDQGERSVTGLQRLDEAALNALGDEAFLTLRRSGALQVGYAQLLSMGQLGVFGDLAKLQAQSARMAQPAAQPAASWEGLLQMPSEDVLRFE
jgi:hypothetical protein